MVMTRVSSLTLVLMLHCGVIAGAAALTSATVDVPVAAVSCVFVSELAAADWAGLGLGGWPDDYRASGMPTSGAGARLDEAVATMRRVWAGELAEHGKAMRRLSEGRPPLLFGGFVSAVYRRVATQGEGWVAPLFGLQMLEAGAIAARQAWANADRTGEPG